MKQLYFWQHPITFSGLAPSRGPSPAVVESASPPESPSALRNSSTVKSSNKLATSVSEAASAPPYAPTAITAFLRMKLRRPVRLVLTENRSTMLSYREERWGVSIRMHKMFAQAPPIVMEALAEYLDSGQKDAGWLVDQFIAERSPSVSRPQPKIRAKGQVHHLQTIFDRLNRDYFHGSCLAKITWGRAGHPRRRRSIQLGCYVAEDTLIRIHPCLDQLFVPEYYLAWVVFHEMLHEVFGVSGHGGKRRSLHPPEFVAVEQSYPDFQRCKAWEKINLSRLLCFRG